MKIYGEARSMLSEVFKRLLEIFEVRNSKGNIMFVLIYDIF